jgi:hypothetical protein
MMYDVVLCLCSISCIFILAEEQVLASVPENNVPATAVTFPVYYAFFLNVYATFITPVFFHITEYLPPICMELGLLWLDVFGCFFFISLRCSN